MIFSSAICTSKKFFLQVAQAAGAHLIATAGSPAKRALLRGLGTRTVLSSRDLHFPGQLAGRHPVHCILNSLTAAGFVAGSVAALAAGGRLVEISKRDIWSPQRVVQERPDLGYSLVAVDFLTPAAVHASLMRVAAGLASAQLTPLPQVLLLNSSPCRLVGLHLDCQHSQSFQQAPLRCLPSNWLHR